MADDRQPEMTLVPGEPNKLGKEGLERLAACRTWKSYIELDVKEAYFFASPWRQRQISSMTAPSQQRMLDAPELNTDQAFILCEDQGTEVMQAFMPETGNWCERGPGMDIDPKVWEKVADKVKEADNKIFSAMKASNLYPECAKTFNPDLNIGTVAVWIHRPHPTSPIVVSAVPFRELEFNLGPYGDPDDRFAVRYTRNSYVRELVGEEIWEKIGVQEREAIEKAPATRTQVTWGYWRLWAEKGDEHYQHVVFVDQKLVHDAVLIGEGSVPLIVGRFGATPDWPHGFGSLLKGLPTFRQVDELERLRIEHSARSINPAITYPDDSFAAVEQGVEDGFAYPVRPGSEGAVKSIYTVPSPEVANYQYEEKVKILRKLFFVDMPEQHGDTPPTLGQWLDEMARAQRRIGTPGMSFWREFPAQIFLRFKYLLEASGAIAPIKVDGRAVATLPRNPAQAAAEQQEVGMAMKALTYVAQTFPEEFKMYVDGKKTIQEIIKKMRVADLIKFRSDDQVSAAVDQMSKVLSNRPVPGPTGQTPGPAA
jgi:hypothetical protein